MSQNSHKFKKQADSRVAKYDIFAYQIHYLSKDNLNIYIQPKYNKQSQYVKIMFYSIYQILSKMKLLLFFCLLTCFVSCDYFGHLPIDSALSTYANEAIKDFLTTLQRHMDCHIDESPLITQTLNHHAFNYIGNFALPHSKTYKKNKEGDSYTYNQPMYKTYIRSHDKTEMYNKLKSVGRYLESIKKLLIEYNNVVVGFENKLKGNNSVVIGSNNTIGGNNFWVFDSNVKEVGIEDGVLIIQNYLIEMADMREILVDPRNVVRCLKGQERQQQVWNLERKVSSLLQIYI